MRTAIKFAKTNPNAIIPTKRLEDAGYDIYACFDEEEMEIPPHTTVMIPTGIASACDTDFCFVLKERGSTGSIGMAQRCGIIDSGYRNEWFVPITNTNDKPIIISKDCAKNDTKTHEFEAFIYYPYTKAICQALVIPVPENDVEEYTYEELKAIPSARGNGRLGSSGK